MVFSSLLFVFIFLPITLKLFYLVLLLLGITVETAFNVYTGTDKTRTLLLPIMFRNSFRLQYRGSGIPELF
jgi:hypothetical protein